MPFRCMEDPECLIIKSIETLLTFDIEARIGPKSHCEESYTEISKKNSKNSSRYYVVLNIIAFKHIRVEPHDCAPKHRTDFLAMPRQSITSGI